MAKISTSDLRTKTVSTRVASAAEEAKIAQGYFELSEPPLTAEELFEILKTKVAGLTDADRPRPKGKQK